ncbi:hypothetical protein JAAARDRAFT_236745 [Jaapia argillacea MUCL 33604]|uniref:Uncharacterized protein n=1 Tax=Jaapia argillacea MUCL 33604 TaxID=933084 RepID=A0A067QQ18_9AGAM|nr:hypothetical protein JAAARDRAFT_236745 [Jaapia argillacea MUCL 33604]
MSRTQLGTIEELSSSGNSPLMSNPLQDASGDESDEETFVYPGSKPNSPPIQSQSSTSPTPDVLPTFTSPALDAELSPTSTTGFVYPGSETETEHPLEADQPSVLPSPSTGPSEPPIPLAQPVPIPLPSPPAPELLHPQVPAPPALAARIASPAQLEALCAAASSGNLTLVQNLFHHAKQNERIEAFELANDASARTGLTALHGAASRGHLEVVRWLIEDCGALADGDDKEGETALHKAALNGHLAIIQYLLPRHSDVHLQDADGWTALHNACSKAIVH